MTYTYNNIITEFQQIANSNPFIKRFGSGELSEVETTGPNSGLYPLMWIVPQQVNLNENSIDWTFRVLVFEIDDIDDSKQQVILSNTLQIMLDVIKAFKHVVDDDITISETQTCIPFTHRFVDYCTGWYADLQITTDIDNSPCDIPEN